VLLGLSAASAAAADAAGMKASLVAGAPAHTPSHHDLAPANSHTYYVQPENNTGLISTINILCIEELALTSHKIFTV